MTELLEHAKEIRARLKYANKMAIIFKKKCLIQEKKHNLTLQDDHNVIIEIFVT